MIQKNPQRSCTDLTQDIKDNLSKTRTELSDVKSLSNSIVNSSNELEGLLSRCELPRLNTSYLKSELLASTTTA